MMKKESREGEEEDAQKTHVKYTNNKPHTHLLELVRTAMKKRNRASGQKKNATTNEIHVTTLRMHNTQTPIYFVIHFSQRNLSLSLCHSFQRITKVYIFTFTRIRCVFLLQFVCVFLHQTHARLHQYLNIKKLRKKKHFNIQKVMRLFSPLFFRTISFTFYFSILRESLFIHFISVCIACCMHEYLSKCMEEFIDKNYKLWRVLCVWNHKFSCTSKYSVCVCVCVVKYYVLRTSNSVH